MAFLKYAKATIQKPGIQFAEWDALRSQAVSPSPDFQRRTAKVILEEYDPAQYMLSHATIVASVDVENSVAPLGKQYTNGFEVDRKYQDYYVTPATEMYINNNNDAFERKLLLAAFKSFIGAHSYVEHVQIPELSKGRIIDAAARDIGDSVYIDILIANELKHAPLIRSIKSGELGTLSMGCSTSSTTCTKCGNVAQDETQLCSCIRYLKGSDFIDEMGVRRKVAELCGHHTDPESVRFIEASWVANPAFKGAVLRKIISVGSEDSAIRDRLRQAMEMPAPVLDPKAMQRAARRSNQQEPDQTQTPPIPDTGDSDQDQEGPVQKAVDDLSTQLRDKAVEKVRTEINKDDAKDVKQVLDTNKQNESLIRSAMTAPEWRKIAKFVISFVGKSQAKRVLHGLLMHKSGGWSQVRQAGYVGKDLLILSRVLDVMTKKSSIAGENRVYRTVLSVGGTAPYEDAETYLAACRQVLGRMVTGSEAARLLEKGRLYSLR